MRALSSEALEDGKIPTRNYGVWGTHAPPFTTSQRLGGWTVLTLRFSAKRGI